TGMLTVSPSTVPDTVTVTEPASIASWRVVKACETLLPGASAGTDLAPKSDSMVSASGTSSLLVTLGTTTARPTTQRMATSTSTSKAGSGASPTTVSVRVVAVVPAGLTYHGRTRVPTISYVPGVWTMAGSKSHSTPIAWLSREPSLYETSTRVGRCGCSPTSTVWVNCSAPWIEIPPSDSSGRT